MGFAQLHLSNMSLCIKASRRTINIITSQQSQDSPSSSAGRKKMGLRVMQSLSVSQQNIFIRQWTGFSKMNNFSLQENRMRHMND